MDRRRFIAGLGAAGFLSGAGIPRNAMNFVTGAQYLTGHGTKTVEGGLILSKAADDFYMKAYGGATFLDAADAGVQNSGRGKTALLFKYLEKALGHAYDPDEQGTGDCVGQASGLGADILTATQIFGLGKKQAWKAKTDRSTIYAGSRYEIGYLQEDNSRILMGEGSHPAYACEFMKKYGLLYRLVYGEYDLREYSARRSTVWGSTGVPDTLEPLAKRHTIAMYRKITSWENYRDAVVNGWPVIIGSTFGFQPNCRFCNRGGRDADGFLKPCGIWNHCMLGSAVDDSHRRPGGCIQNSWGPNWVGGPKRHGQPDGSFWVDAEVIDDMVKQGMSYAISNFSGFVEQSLDYQLF